jgi:hypothetical protein
MLFGPCGSPGSQSPFHKALVAGLSLSFIRLSRNLLKGNAFQRQFKGLLKAFQMPSKGLSKAFQRPLKGL